jgi:multidrug efflux pump subunit AcrB
MNNKPSLLSILLHYRKFIILVTLIFAVVGIIALVQMPRDEFPEFTIRQGLIIGIYPGANSEQVEEQLTKKVENYLFQYEEIDKGKTHSVSKENVMVIYVEVGRKVKDQKAFWAKLRHGLNEFKGSLPSGVLSLTASDDFGNTSAILLTVESETRTYKELEKYIEKLEDQIRTIPATSRVKHFGLQQEEISVYIDDAKLTRYGVKPLMVLAALKPESMVNYSGEIDDGTLIRPIHIPSSYKTESDIANQIVYSDPLGNVIRIKDVAHVVREYKEPASYIRVNGKKCLLVSLEMVPGHNIVQYGSRVKKEIASFAAEVPADIRVSLISDMPYFVSSAIVDFLRDFGIAIFSVILVTLLLLPWQVALVAASTIPISILITLGIMWMTGSALQTVSLAGLVIVLGMVVDNAIVVIDNYVEKLDNGISPYSAASQSVTDLFGSVFSATLIIVMCFVPMTILMTGTASDFIRSLPSTIAYALFISLIVTVLLVPMMCYRLIKHGVKGDDRGGKSGTFLKKLQGFYDNFLEKSFTSKKTVVLVGALSFIVGMALLALSPQQSFPNYQRNQFAVEVTLPTGSSLQQTDSVMKEIEELLLRDKRVKEVAAFVGTSSPRFNAIYAPMFPGKNIGQLLVITGTSKDTEKMLDEYSAKIADNDPRARIKWKQLGFTPFMAPIEVRISGDSITTIRKVAAQVASILRTTPGTVWVGNDFQAPLQAVQLNVNQDEASRLGYSKPLLDYSLMIGTKGFPVSTIWEGDYPVTVTLKVDKKTKTNVDDILNQYVTSPYLASAVQVRQLAELQPVWTEGEIARRNGVRTITVMADPRRDAYASTVLGKAQPRIDALQLPKGVRLTYGGELETAVVEVTPLYYSLMVSIAIIFLILLFQFRKIKTVLLVMMTVPLSVFGAAVGTTLMGYPFSVTAFIGVIGLIGIVVRNGIIYIAYAEELREKQGLSLEEAAISAAKRRMRPIFLTAAAAAVGVVPMVLGRSPLWGPLGTAVCFGLLFAMPLCLIVLPVLYYLAHRKDSHTSEEIESV